MNKTPPSDDSNELEEARQEIDRVDRDLVRLLKERMDAVEQVAASKEKSSNAGLVDPGREAKVADAWGRQAEKHGLSPYFTHRVLREILNHSRRSQETLLEPPPERTGACRVGFQGTRASYSELAIGKLFEARKQEVVERTGFSGFPEVFDALENGKVDYALLPVENSLVGSVSEVNQLVVTRNVAVVDEELWDVEHCLAGLPGATAENLTQILSHPIALLQCQGLVSRLEGASARGFSDTAEAAVFVRANGDPETGAICSAEAASLADLEILIQDVGDYRGNQTRFLLLARQSEPASRRHPAKTTLVFAAQDRCGALGDCLGALSEHGVNLTRLESRPQPEAPWEYTFLADLEGHQDEDHVAAALAALRRVSNHLRILGTYPSRTPLEKKDSTG
jgi:chorismate mutase/prephenate dehydratase